MQDPKEDYEETTSSISDVDQTDIKINPDYYLHRALLQAINAMNKDDPKQAFLLFRMSVELVESLCKAAKRVPDDYEDSLKKFKASDTYAREEDVLVKETRFANYKFELLLTDVFGNKTLNAPLKA